MDAHSGSGDAHSVSAVAVIDLSDGGAGDPHGLLTSSVVVIGGNEENDASGSTSGGGASDGLLQGEHTADEEDDDEEEEDEEDGGGGCAEGCTHDHATPVHMIHIGNVGSLNLHRQVHGGHGNHGNSSAASSAPQSPTPSSTASATTSTPGRTGSVSSSGKRKRVVLSIHEKQQVLHRLELGEQPVVISREFGISRQQVSDIKKNKDRILAFCIDAKHLSSLRRKTLKATTEYHPGVEQELYRWLIRQRKLDRGVTSESLSHKTTDLFMQYAADDAANVSFRSIHIWLRHFKRAHHIKNISEDELAKLPAVFTPAMDMAGASHGADVSSSATGGSVGHVSPLLSSAASTGTATTHAHGGGATSGVAGMDDVSSYMSSMVLPPSSQPQPHSHNHLHHHHLHQGNQYLLQNHAPPVDAATSQSFQMLMLPSATDTTGSRTSTTSASAVAAAAASASVLSSTSLQSCAHLAQTLTLQLSLFEREIANKLDALDMRVVRLGVRVLAQGATPSLPRPPQPPSTQFA